MDTSELTAGIGSIPVTDEMRPAIPDRYRPVWQPRSAAENWRWFARWVGARYHGCRLDTFEVSDPKQQAVVDALAACEFDRSIVLFGPPGTGKDHLLIGMAHRAMKARKWVRWHDGESLWRRYRDIIGTETHESEVDVQLTSPDVLILSDPIPPQGSLTEHQLRALFRIVDKRYRERRPTWVSLNVASGDEAAKRMGPQVRDRLRDGGLLLHCDWPSYRKPA